MCIRDSFKAPKSIVDLFTSVLINETMIESIERDLKKDDIIIEHDLTPNPSWATAENPAGEMRSIGRLIKLPKSNALLTFSVSATVVKNGVTQSRVFGSGE
eukprot:TRINITY_DN23309_c0_g1_i2.p1 TRINITY_DN23309_c0_g1~~TRINITY_DN23309_c0_g1_i2.p1  ORF type:complete len:101 (+),score=33.63 TRINITY_DN23309_c0_g1_i2:64-366(+)